MTLKNFPRNGKEVQERKPSDLLFDKYEKIGKRNREKQRAKKQDKGESNFVPNTAERLSHATISEGLVVLGCIFEVTNYDLLISLPGGLVGRAQITDISECYTNLLQSLVKSQDSQTNEFKSLPELYTHGDYVVCYVKAIQSQETLQISISLEPSLINQSLDVTYLDSGSKIVCTISSIEDHGYVVDTGLINVRAFIPTKESGNEKCLFPGKQLLCYVKEVRTNENTSTITLTLKEKLVKAICETEIKSVDSLMPGTKFNLPIKKVLSNGLCVSLDENNIGFINQIYLDEPLSKYSNSLTITGTLLYILPTIKFAYFSSTIDKSRDNTIKPGDVVEGAIALFRESRGIVLQLTKNGIRGFVSLKRTGVEYNKIIEKFAPGTTHKCRILSYSWLDGIYLCTMQRSLLEQKYFSLSDFKPGDVVNVKITNIDKVNGFVNVQLGKFNGQIAPDHISDEGLSALKELKVDKEVEARVLSVHIDRKKVYLTLKRSLITSDLPILANIQDAKIDSKHHATIIQIHKRGILVKFFGDVKGWISHTALDTETSNVNWNYSIGQTILVKVQTVDTDSGEITVKMVNQDIQAEKAAFDIGEEVEGTIIESSTQGLYLRISRNEGQTVSTGFLPAGHMSPCMEIAALLASKYVPGDTLSALVFATVPNLILTRTIVTQGRYRNFEKLKIGDCIPCTIKDMEPDGIRLILPVAECTPFGYVSYSNVSNFNLLHTNQILMAKIFSINKKEQQLGLTLSLKKIYDDLSDPKSRMVAALDTLILYFNKLVELSSNSYYKNRPISSVKLGQRVTGKIEKITADGLVVQLQNNLLGIVSKDHYSENKKIGDKISGTIIWKNYVHELVELTTLSSIMHKISAKQNKQIQFPDGKLLRGRILMVTNWFILIFLQGIGKGTLAAIPVRRHINDLQPDLTPYTVHSKIKCYALLNSKESDIMPLCIIKSAFERKYCVRETSGDNNNLKRKKQNQENVILAKKIKIEKLQEVPKMENKRKRNREKSENDLEKEYSKTICVQQTEEEKIKLEDTNPSKNNLRYALKNVNNDKDNQQRPRTSACGFFWDDKPDLTLLQDKESSSDSEDEIKEKPKLKNKKLNAAERREQDRQKEREIRQREEALANNQLPNSVDQFDRLVLANPDSSIIWLQYMAYHLQTTEIEKARAVARRAVKTINFREENEKLNVWNAWLNLESKFGIPESLNDVFQEAVRSNDSLKIYNHMLTVHVEAGRQIELEKTINTMIGKFKHIPEIWFNCGEALIKMGLKDKSRHIMQRALQSLPASEHVNLMVRFAIMENKFGDKERAQTLFEQILSSYPKRVDIWSCYVDSLVKSNDIDIARKVLERAVVQTLPPRKMKILFKKFINFEEQHGTQEDVIRVQQMAVEYVEKQCTK
ncbi:ribosomal RNA Processing 5 [Bombus fervidus]|uniref:ribosomal RNA Processing 5 n=1 Tax=Bombus fervidus TaxID=203811 RepID=UPI003AB330DE